MKNHERMLFWELVKSLKKPENLQSDFYSRAQYGLKDIRLIVTDSGFTNKIIADGIIAVDSGATFELRNGNAKESAGLLQEISA